MEDYRFSTAEPMPTNSDTMSYFLNDNTHFRERFNDEWQVISVDGTYAEVENSDGKIYAVHAGGDGDFFNHRIRFELLTQYRNPSTREPVVVGCAITYTEQEMIDCFTAGVKFARDMMSNPSNTEYMQIINDKKELPQ